MKKEDGFTLVELMVVVSITALLLTWGVPSYSTWKKKHDIENQMVQLYSDLQFTRMNAYGTKVVSGVWWGGGTNINTYWVKSDTSNNGNFNTQIGGAVNVKRDCAITSSAPQNSVSFDGRGFGPVNSITFNITPTYGAGIDCVAVSSTRIILGRMNGNTCMPR
jgi:prepilin-type N-terminal cleavage/methylation domain-containing protein